MAFSLSFSASTNEQAIYEAHKTQADSKRFSVDLVIRDPPDFQMVSNKFKF